MVNYILKMKHLNTIFKKLNEYYTSMPVQYDSLYDYNNLRRSYGRCADQVTAVGRKVLSGMFEEFPDAKFINSMLAGAFFHM